MSLVDWRDNLQKSGLYANWHGACEVVIKRNSVRNTMFGKSLSTASSLDKAIVACVAAMLGFNLFVLSSQLQAAPAFAKIQVEAVAQQV